MSDQPLRVAIVGAYPVDPARISGGIRAVTYHVVEGLRGRADVDVTVIHCHSDVPEDRLVSSDNITVRYLALPRQRVVPNMVTGVRRIEQVLRDLRPDLVNAHGHSYAVAALNAGYTGPRSPVWTVHGVIGEEARYNPGLFNRLAYGLAGLYERRALREVREIMAISPYIRERFAPRTRASMRVVENPAPEDMFGLPRAPVPGRVLLAASVTPRKDLLTAVRAVALAARQVPDIRLQVAGSLANADYVTQVRAACAELDVANRVEFLGLQSREQMRGLYREAQLVMLSSREEVSPMSAIEALAAGIPVVTTRAGGAGYVVDDGRTGRVVDLGDSAALAEAIVGLMRNTDLYSEMSGCAAVVARERFHPRRVADRYLEVYRTVWQAAQGAAR
jgi:glycosyltransferase involved in cell wall biosynthesis